VCIAPRTNCGIFAKINQALAKHQSYSLYRRNAKVAVREDATLAAAVASGRSGGKGGLRTARH